MVVRQVHDRGYLRVFSNKHFFRQLIETFVKKPWVATLDFARSEKLDKSYISAQYKQTTGDLLFKVPFLRPMQKKYGKNAYVCIFTEMQSTSPHYMVVRSGQYVMNFYADLIEGGEKPAMLPPVLPIVLYNGEAKWTAPIRLSDVIHNHVLLGAHGIDLEIYLIAEQAYAVEELEDINNVVSTLFLADAHCQSLDTVVKAINRLFDTSETFENIMVLVEWYFNLIDAGRRSKSGASALLDTCRNKEEVKTMLERVIEEERRKYQALGIAEGKAEGEVEGKAEGEAKTKRAVAKNMLLEQANVAFIARCTGLSEAEILQLRDDTQLH